MRTRIVKFYRWHDPIRELVEHFDSESDNQRYGVVGLEDDEPDEVLPVHNIPKRLGPMLVGPQGIIPLTDKNCPSASYSFWMMHTNFNLSMTVVQQIERVDGVESLNIFSRYRARLSVGELFKDEEVKQSITDLLCVTAKTKKIDSSIYDNVTKFLSSRYQYWAIVTVGKTLVPISGNNKEEVDNKIKEQKNCTEVIKSWDETAKTSNL